MVPGWRSSSHGIPCLPDQRVFVAENVADAENVAPDGGRPERNKAVKIIESDNVIDDDDKNWYHADISTAEIENSRLRRNFRAPQKLFCSESVWVPADMLVVVVLAEQSMELERKVMNCEQTLISVKWELPVA